MRSDPGTPESKQIHCYPASFSDADGGYSDPDRDWVNVAQGIRKRHSAAALALASGSTCSSTQAGTDIGGGQRSGSFPKGVKVDGGAAGCCKACDAAEAQHANSAKGCKAWVATADGKPDSSGMQRPGQRKTSASSSPMCQCNPSLGCPAPSDPAPRQYEH